MIKFDIEGGEFAIVNEAFDSGVLRNMTRRAVRIDMIIEVHGKVRVPKEIHQ
jgi:hypothetical protein